MSNSAFARALGTPATQREVDRSDQVLNNAGGFVFGVSDETRLQRFLILGTEKGTFYAKEKKLTKDNVSFLIDLIKRNEQLVEDTVVEISQSGRAYRNSPAIFTVAALFRYGKSKSSFVVQAVCRTGTHIFEFASYVDLLGGWSRSTRRAVSDWYKSQSVDGLAYQVVKYRQRNGWSHRDLFRLAHPVGVDTKIGNFILGKDVTTAARSFDEQEIIRGFKFAQEAETVSELLGLALTDYPNLPWEAIPTHFHKNVDVWKKLFYNGQLKGQALLRNITRLARLGAFNDMLFANEYAVRLADEAMIARTRLHPMQYLLAMIVHSEGQVDRDSSTMMHTVRDKNWATSPVIMDALDKGYNKAFKFVEPAAKRTMVALDVSGSMSGPAMGVDLSCVQVGAAMAMTIMRTEPYYMGLGFSHQLVDLGIHASMSIPSAVHKIDRIPMGSTDCSLPMVHAAQQNIAVDTFVVITDNETWSGDVHPYQALRTYRRKMGIDAKLVVVGLTATQFSIADPTDRGMLDVVGGDANLPSIIADFSAGRI